MANKIIGINLNGVDYDYEDEETASQTEENASKIGDLADLTTTAKTDLVSAINEVNSGSSAVGDLADLTTTAKTNVVSAINEVNAKAGDNADAIGDLASLTTTAKTSAVSAINEVNAKAGDNADAIGDLENLTTTAKTDLVSAINEVNAKPIGIDFIDFKDLLTTVTQSGFGQGQRLSKADVSSICTSITIGADATYNNSVGNTAYVSFSCVSSQALAERLSAVFGSRWDNASVGIFVSQRSEGVTNCSEPGVEDFVQCVTTLFIQKLAGGLATMTVRLTIQVIIAMSSGTHNGATIEAYPSFFY